MSSVCVQFAFVWVVAGILSSYVIPWYCADSPGTRDDVSSSVLECTWVRSEFQCIKSSRHYLVDKLYSLSLVGIFSCGDVLQQNVPQSHHKTPNTTLNHLHILAVTCMIDTAGISPVAAVGNDTARQLPAQLLTDVCPYRQYCRQINVHAWLCPSLPGLPYHVTHLYIRIGCGYVIRYIILVCLLDLERVRSRVGRRRICVQMLLYERILIPV